MYTVPHEEKHIQPVWATTSSSVRSGKHIFCWNRVRLKRKALWAAAKLYSELAFADILSHPDWGRNCTKIWMSLVHLKAISEFTAELLIFELEKHPLSLVCRFTPPPAATLFSCSEPLFWAACAQAGRAVVWGDWLPVTFSTVRLTIWENQHHAQCSRNVTYKTWLNDYMIYICILMYNV